MNQPANADASPQTSPSRVGHEARRPNTRRPHTRSTSSMVSRRTRVVASRLRVSVALLAGTIASAPLGACGGDWERTPWAGYRRGGPAIRQGPGPIYRTLDAVAGGIERVFGLHSRGHGCDEAGCDDGCDTATLHALMPGHGHPLPPGTAFPHPGLIPVPSREAEVPSDRLPSHRPPSHRPPSDDSPSLRRPRSESLPEPGSDEDDPGSFFDTLSDPFEDDSAGLQPVRPGVAARERDALRPYTDTTAPMGLRPVSVTTPAER